MPNIFEQMANQGTPLEGQKPDKLATSINRQVTNNVPAENNPQGVGTVPATEEENMKLEKVLDGIEEQIHGPFRDDLVDVLRGTSDPWMNISQAAYMLLKGADTALASEKVDLEPDYWFGENGIIQSTVEMVYELALAADAPGIEDENQLDAAYMRTVQMIGEELFEADDTSATEAQLAMVDMEFGEGASDLAAEGFELSDMQAMQDDLLAETATEPGVI